MNGPVPLGAESAMAATVVGVTWSHPTVINVVEMFGSAEARTVVDKESSNRVWLMATAVPGTSVALTAVETAVATPESADDNTIPATMLEASRFTMSCYLRNILGFKLDP